MRTNSFEAGCMIGKVTMLKQVLMIHPLGQAAALIFGIFNLVTGWTRRCFLIPVHINVGVMCYALTFIGCIMGVLAARIASNKDMVIRDSFHLIVAAGFMLVLIIAALTGFMLLGRKGRQTWLHAVHRYGNCAVVILFLVQFVSGLKVLAGVW
jgi:hypothetical protein